MTITLFDLVAASGYKRPEEHFKVIVYDPDCDKHGTEEFAEHQLDTYTLARYGKYPVDEFYAADGDMIEVMIPYAGY